jgi:hypothetical protein
MRTSSFMGNAARCIGIALVGVAVAAGACAAEGDDALLVPPRDPIAGRSQSEWSRSWWQWAGSFARSESPIVDRTGAMCTSKQSGDVWFLAGTYGTRRTIRECTVPAGKYLFFPLVNYVVMSAAATPCAQLMEQAALITDDPDALVLDVDGMRIANLSTHRQATQGCFQMGSLSREGATHAQAAANGYWVMLRPLAKGKHTIEFGGALPGILQAVTYTLVVE